MNSSFGQIFDGRYNLLRVVKRGAGIETVLGSDVIENRLVLIKTADAKSLPLSAQLRVELEVARLRDARSTSLAPILRYAKTESHVCLIRPYIPGISLEEKLQKGQPLQVRESLSIGCCVLAALQEAHQQGVHHLNIKPSEVILQEADTVQGCVLTDFSFVRHDVGLLHFCDRLVGHAAYLSPEQSGVINDVVDHRADLHAVGVLLFTGLVGRPPFDAETINELLRKQLSMPPPYLRALGLPIPRALDEAVQRLLRKDPLDRYQSAAAALADLRALAQALDQGLTNPSIVVGGSDRRSSLAQPSFIGRTAELVGLDAELASARQGHLRLAVIEAPSGGGKTTLLDEFEQGSMAQGAWVVRGRGETEAVQRPFQIVDGIVRAIHDATEADPNLKTAFQQHLDTHALRTVIYTMFPRLMALARSPVQPLQPEAYGEIKVVQALCALLSTLGAVKKPAVVLLDDCQWADELMLKFLTFWSLWQDQPQELGSHVLLVVAFRSEDVPVGHLLRTLRPSAHLTLPPFESEDMCDLLRSMAGPLPREPIQFITNFSEGSPFMATAILRGLVESRALEFVPPIGRSGPHEFLWRLMPRELIKMQSSRQAAILLVRRLDLLPADTLRLLTIGAILGHDFDLALAATLAGHPRQDAATVLEEARQRHFVWVDPQRNMGTFIHDKLRQTLLSRLSIEERQDLHRQAAVLIEESDRERVYELAHHLHAAGNYEKALPYALTAARLASSQYSLETAEHYYRIAEHAAPTADVLTRQTVAMGLGHVLMQRGRYEEAARRLQEARPLTPDTFLQAQLDAQFGELAMKRGDVKEACEALERALHLLGRPAPRTPAKLLMLLLRDSLVQASHTLLPSLFLRPRSIKESQAELFVVRLHSLLAHAYFFHRDMVSAIWSHVRALNLADHYPMTEELAKAYTDHGFVMSMLPNFRRGKAFAERGLAIRTALGCARGQAQSLHFYGIILSTQSRFAEALEKYRQAITLLERTGDRWEMNIVLYHLACCLYRMGDLRGAIETSRRLHVIGLEIGDRHAVAISLEPWAKASNGKVPADLIEAALRGAQEDAHTRMKLLQAKGLSLLDQGQPHQAVLALVEALTLSKRTGQRSEYVASIPTWLAMALRQEADMVPVFNPRHRRTLLRRAQAMARHGLRLARSFPNNLPHALRENAVLATIQGRSRRALRLFKESLSVAEHQGAVYEYAQTLLAKGQTGLALGWDRAEQDVTCAQDTIRLLAASMPEQQSVGASKSGPDSKQATWSLIDRVDTLMNIGHRITSALTRNNILAEVWNAAQALLRGEQCVVIERQRDGEAPFWKTIAGDMAEEMSRAMVNRARASSRPIVFTPGLPEDTVDSLVASGVRTALCAPIMVHGQVMGYVCVAHYQINTLFGEEEIRFAEFITKLAGASLEKAEGFEELQGAHKQLHTRAENAALLAEISAVVTKLGNLPSLLQECAEVLVRHFSVACVHIWTHNESMAMLELQASAGRYTPIDVDSRIPVGTRGMGHSATRGSSVIGRIAQDRQPYFTNTLSTDPFIQDRQWVDRESLVSFAAYPLTVENRVVGVMAMYGHHLLPDDTLEHLSFIAESLAQCVIRKWADGEIRALNFELEGRVALRTKELEAAKAVLEVDLLTRKQDERRLTAHYAVTRQLAESTTLEQTTVHILATICENLNWQAGVFWRVDKDTGMMRYVDSWSSSTDQFADFTALSLASSFRPGEGFPGRIWAHAKPLWIEEIQKEENFPRSPSAHRAGLRCAFGFPVILSGDILGAMEFFSSEVQAPDEDLLKMMMAIGSQIGQFIERTRAEEALRASEERFRTVAETAAEGIITIDETSTIKFVNRATEHIFGYTSAEMLGQNMTMLMPERLRSAHQHAMARYLTTQKRHLTWEIVHLPGLHKNGNEIPLELAFWEFTQHSRKYFGSIVRDITDRVQMAELRHRLLEQVIFAQEEERKRIARELHDETGQALMSLLVGLQTIEMAPTLIAAKGHAKQQRQFVAQALDEVRRLAMGLRPSALDDLGIVAALERYTAEFAQTYGIAVDIHAHGLENNRLPSTIETTLYRIIQEALTNVSKHSGATIVSIVIERLPSCLRAIIEDNGSGFDVDATIQSLPRTKHLGLLSMQERAGLVNGSAIIESTAAGTTVCLRIPVEETLHGKNQNPDR